LELQDIQRAVKAYLPELIRSLIRRLYLTSEQMEQERVDEQDQSTGHYYSLLFNTIHYFYFCLFLLLVFITIYNLFLLLLLITMATIFTTIINIFIESFD